MFLKKLHYVCLESYFLLKKKNKPKKKNRERKMLRGWMISQEKRKVGIYNANYLNCKCGYFT